MELLNDDHIFLNLDIADRNKMFEHVSKILSSNNYINDEYLTKVIEREEEHPTGFKLKATNVAMPHVDSKHVKQNGFFIVTSKNGIIFKNAETDEDLNVKIVFGLLLKDSQNHLNFLMKLASSFKDEERLNRILNSSSKTEVKELLNSILSN